MTDEIYLESPTDGRTSPLLLKFTDYSPIDLIYLQLSAAVTTLLMLLSANSPRIRCSLVPVV